MKKSFYILLIFFVFLAGCNEEQAERQKERLRSSSEVTEGIIVDIIPMQIDDTYQGLYVEFEDGRFTKFRCVDNDMVTLKKRKVNKIYHEKNGKIKDVEIFE